jgi:hypothetical protein
MTLIGTCREPARAGSNYLAGTAPKRRRLADYAARQKPATRATSSCSPVREHRDSIPEGAGPAGQPLHIFHRRCACPCHLPSSDGGDGGTMAKKDTPKQPIGPKNAKDYLARLPQFEPRPIPFADLQEYDVQVQREQGIDVQEQGKQRIDDVLSKFMAPYISDATKLQPFLNDAKRAIAGYVGARETEYDRRKAKELLSATSIDLETTKRKLQEIARWPELSNYLKRLYRDASEWPWEFKIKMATSPRLAKRPQRRRKADLGRSYSDFAPAQTARRLSQLETVVSLAAERVTFGPGDAQRDQIAQDFTDQLASAWHSATERKPTCSRPTQRLKNLSPFARLLETINQRLLLKKRHRSPNNFFEYGAKAIKRLRPAVH